MNICLSRSNFCQDSLPGAPKAVGAAAGAPKGVAGAGLPKGAAAGARDSTNHNVLYT